MWKIKDWNETFENADTRKRVRLGWFLCPTGVDSSGYIELMSHGPDGVQAFGVFLAICQWSATCLPVVRGLCARSDGRALTLRQIASIVRISEDIVTKSFELLSSSDVRWMEWDESATMNKNTGDADSVPVACQSPATSLPDACRKEKEKEKEKEKKSVYEPKPQQTQKPSESHPGGIDEVIIPSKMNTPACLEAARKFWQYLSEKGADYKRPDLSATALEAWWREMARIGPAKFPEAVERSMAGGHLSVKVLPDPAEAFKGPKAKPDANGDWLHALNICRRYSTASQQDTIARREELTPAQLAAVKEVGLHRIAQCTSYDYKQVSEQFTHALKGAAGEAK